MNNRLMLCTIAIVMWTIFVIYCLFNGSKVEIQTMQIKKMYWFIMAITVCFAIYLVCGLLLWSIILMFIMLLATSLYISIPCGYSDKGIFIRGFFFPYKKIESMKIENILGRSRLNFKCYHYIFYIDSDSYRVLKDCETLYKKEKIYD